MKYFLTITFLITLSLISISQTLDFKFYNSHGIEYKSTSLNEQLEKEYHSKIQTRIILAGTENLYDKLYSKQKKTLDSLDGETLQLIFVTACLTKENRDGYYTSIEDSRSLIGKDQSFSIRIIDSKANVIFESRKVISTEKIKSILNE